MKAQLSAVLLSLLFVAAVPGPAAAAPAAHDHQAHGAADAPKLQLNAGRKWATDEALRQSMADINQAMAKALPLIHKDKFGDDQYRALATSVNQKVAYAVANCKLDAKADAMLHLVIADLLAGAEIMEGKTPGARHDGAVKVLEALHGYGKYFQHPGWRATKG